MPRIFLSAPHLGTLEEALPQLDRIDGVMLGRAAYQTPYDTLAGVDRLVFGETSDAPSREEIVHALLPYAAGHIARGGRLNNITRHVLGLYHGRPRGRLFRRYLSEHATRSGAGAEVLEHAMLLAEGRIVADERRVAAVVD